MNKKPLEQLEKLDWIPEIRDNLKDIFNLLKKYSYHVMAVNCQMQNSNPWSGNMPPWMEEFSTLVLTLKQEKVVGITSPQSLHLYGKRINFNGFDIEFSIDKLEILLQLLQE